MTDHKQRTERGGSADRGDDDEPGSWTATVSRVARARVPTLNTTDRRSLIRGAATGVIAGIAGCSLLSGDETFEAAPVSLSGDVDVRGYDLVGTDRPEVTRTVSVADAEREVTLRSHYASYEQRAGLAVGLVSTPAVSEAGQSLNPVASEPIPDLLTREAGAEFSEQLKLQSEWARGPEAVGTDSGRLLEQSTEFTTYAGVTTAGSFVLLNAARVEHEGDAVLVGFSWQTETRTPDRPFVGEDGYVPPSVVDGTAADFADLLPLVVHGVTPAGTAREPRDATPQSLIEAPEDDEAWKILSGQVLAARSEGAPTSVNDDLRTAAEAVTTPGLGMVFEFWIAENHLHAGEYESAARQYADVLDRYEDPRFLGQEFRPILLRKRAAAQEELGRIDDALATYDELVEATGGTAAQPHYRKGLTAERAAMDETAIRAYETAAATDDPEHHHLYGLDEMAVRAAARVRTDFDGFHDSEPELRRRVADGLNEGRAEVIADLASPTHFTIRPVGGCASFVTPDPFVERLVEDAAVSDVVVDPEDVTLAGSTVYLHSEGWDGELYTGRVSFELSDSPQGWSLEGIAVRKPQVLEYMENHPEFRANAVSAWDFIATPTPTDTPTATPTPTPTPEPTPEPNTSKYPSIDIAAPFRDGENFRAGGYPSGGGGGCGTGIAGYYYKQGPTHRASSGAKHAVDFTQYLGPAGTISARGKRVLATNSGVVDTVVEKYKNGSNNGANLVSVKHHARNRCGIYADYLSRYLHLTGKYDVPVSEGQHVVQGSRLGYMDNSGTSVVHHLHFNVRNLASDESVRPSPMDGQHLTSGDAGKCITSSNVQSVVRTGYTHSEPSC